MRFCFNRLIHSISYSILRVLNKKVFLLSFLLSQFVYAQSADDTFRFIKPEFKLPEYSISDIVEDYKGFMWFATHEGLCRYDGIDMVVYANDVNDSTSISNTIVNSIYEGRDSVLWVGTQTGLNVFNRERNNFITLLPDSVKKHARVNVIMDIAEDIENNIWLATRGGVVVWLRKEKRFFRFQCFDKKKLLAGANKFRSVAIDKDGNVLAGNVNGDVLSLDLSTGVCQQLKFDNGKSKRKELGEIRTLFISSDEAVWVGTIKTGLLKINKIENGHVWYKQFTNNISVKNSRSLNSVLSICELDSNRLLIGTENFGLNLLDRRTDRFTVYTANGKDPNSLSGNSIWSMYKRSSGDIWFGIFDKGINILFNQSLKINDVKHDIYNPNSLSFGAVTSFAEDDKGNMWVSFNGSGLDYWDRKKNIFYHLNYNDNKPGRMLGNAPTCLLRLNTGEIWAGFYNSGISVVSGIDEKQRGIIIRERLSSVKIIDIAGDNEGRIYIATMGGGLNIYNTKTDEIEIFRRGRSKGIRSNYINDVYFDSKGNLWIGFVDNGVDKMYRDSTGRVVFVNYEFDINNENSISSNRIFSINEDKDGNIWIGTGHGLNKLDVITGKVKRYLNGVDMMSNVMVGVIPDEKGRVWLSTYDGLKMFDSQKEEFFSYSEKNRLSSQRFSKRGSYYKSSNGELFFGGNDGFISFYPDSIRKNNEKLRLYFTNLLLFNEPAGINTSNTPLEKCIMEAEKIVLNPNQSVFTLKYVALNFKNPDNVQYAYYLDGFEDKWNYVGNKREATYTNLNPGSYTFKLKCANDVGHWSEEPISIQIEVLPPWWKTKIFYFLSITLIFLLFQLYLRFRIRAVDEKKRQLGKEVKERTKELEEKTEELLGYQSGLEKLVKERTIELEKAKEKAEESDRLKSAFLANMSHEIRTPMNAIVGFSQLLKLENVDVETMGMFISQISSNTDSLLTLIDDILDLSRIESGQVTIVNKEFDLNDLLEEVMADISVSTKNDKTELRLTNTAEKRNLKLNSDRTRIKQILSNMLNNACKFTEEGYVDLRFAIEDSKIKFSVQDTGLGIPEDKLNEIFDRFRVVDKRNDKLYGGTGLGLAISHKLAHMLGGDILVSSVINEGSIFILVLPDDIIA